MKCENISGNCLICGKNIEQGVKMKEVLSGNFTNWGECKSRTSQYICKECTAAIKEKSIRTSSFVADKNKLYLLKKMTLKHTYLIWTNMFQMNS